MQPDLDRDLDGTADGSRRNLLVLGGSSLYVLLLLKSLTDAGLLGQFSRITLFGRDRARLAYIAGAGAALAAGSGCRVDYSDDFAASADTGYDIVFNQSVSGLAKGSPVTFAGIPVGRSSAGVSGILSKKYTAGLWQ